MPRRKVSFRFGSTVEESAAAAAPADPAGPRVADGPDADSDDADEGEWAHLWVAEEAPAELSTALLAPPPPPNAPTPVVPSFERTYLSPTPGSASELGSRRKRWFRAVDA